MSESHVAPVLSFFPALTDRLDMVESWSVVKRNFLLLINWMRNLLTTDVTEAFVSGPDTVKRG